MPWLWEERAYEEVLPVTAETCYTEYTGGYDLLSVWVARACEEKLPLDSVAATGSEWYNCRQFNSTSTDSAQL